jgi:uncharacterized DUF497 family protein
LRIDDFLWSDAVVDHISKHNVVPREVEECFFNSHKPRRGPKGKYYLLGRTDAGRYMFIVFAWRGTYVKIITARDMTSAERDDFRKK